MQIATTEQIAMLNMSLTGFVKANYRVICASVFNSKFVAFLINDQ
jgi:hypothetical protein